MAEFRYRAYISYSHADERWAAWLQRALESYRVPARLAPRMGGELPRRISPVFRDREDLSSANSLTGSLVEALRDSEALIVICSPSAAASKWVNEEVRQFQALGRADRVLCMIVDGDPAAGAGPRDCFPPALFGGVQDAAAEPLAADPRAFADGKKLAKLKLVAGLLGVRLDDLRQRDLKRRRRWQAVGMLAVIAAVSMAAVTVSSRIAQQHEREKAEQMANFIVDLGEDLQSELDVESLGRINERAMAYLQDLDSQKLSLETNIRVGLALRQLGVVNLRQAKSEAALQAFERSRALFRDLNQKHPDRDDLLFELGQAEFYVGDTYYEAHDIDLASKPWDNYFEISKTLYDKDPTDRRWLLELSYASLNLMTLHILGDKPADQSLLNEVDRNVELAQRTLQAWPGSSEAMANYSNTLAWAADAQLKACNLVEAGQYRLITLDHAQRATEGDPSNKALKSSWAYRHFGLAMVLIDQGNLAEAEQHLLASLDILTALLAMDPSNQLLARGVAIGQRALARLMRDTSRLETALDLMRQSERVLRPEPSPEQTTQKRVAEYSEFLLDYAELLLLRGDIEGAHEALSNFLDIARFRLQSGRPSRTDRELAARLRYLWWEIEGEDLAERYPELEAAEVEPVGQLQQPSCDAAALAARLDIVSGDWEAAKRQAEYLANRGYREPEYLRFCQQYGLCSP